VAPRMDHRGRHWRRRSHHGRGRRWRRRRRRRAGSQCESRDKSGRAERPASRDKTHVSPPRVESDTLHQLDTQSRAAQDDVIIAPSRLFSMGNLTTNHGNDDHPDFWGRRPAGWKAQCNPSTAGRGRPRLRQGRFGCPLHPDRRCRTPWTLGSLGHGRPAYEIQCAERGNPIGRDRTRHFILGSRDLPIVARISVVRTRHGGNERLSSTKVPDFAMSGRHSCPALPSAARARRRELAEALVLAAARSTRTAIRRDPRAVGPPDRASVTLTVRTGGPELPARSLRSGFAATPRRWRRADRSIGKAALHRALARAEIH